MENKKDLLRANIGIIVMSPTIDGTLLPAGESAIAIRCTNILLYNNLVTSKVKNKNSKQKLGSERK